MSKFHDEGELPPLDNKDLVQDLPPDDDDDDGQNGPQEPKLPPLETLEELRHKVAIGILAERLEREYGESWWEHVAHVLQADYEEVQAIWVSRPWRFAPGHDPEELARRMWKSGISQEELDLEIPLPGKGDGPIP